MGSNVLWMAKFRSGLQQLEDAARPGKPATTTTNQDIENTKNTPYRCKIRRETIG